MRDQPAAEQNVHNGPFGRNVTVIFGRRAVARRVMAGRPGPEPACPHPAGPHLAGPDLAGADLAGLTWQARTWQALTWQALSQRAVHWAWQAAQRAGAVTAGSPAGDRFAAFGSGSVLAFPPGAIFGEAWIEIGADTVIGKHVSVSAGTVPGQDLGPVPRLRIGDRCVIGRGTHIVAHESIVIGDDVFAGPYVYITDQNHSYADPDAPIGRQWPANAPVSIGTGSWLGAGAIILPGSVIGRNVVVGAGSVVRGQVPDRCVVAGVPAKIIRAYVAGDGWLPMRADAA